MALQAYRVCIDGNGKYMPQGKAQWPISWCNMASTACDTLAEAEQIVEYCLHQERSKRLTPIPETLRQVNT